MNSARQWHPTVIMLDLKMPGTDGVQLLRSLAADNCSAHVVLTSGSDEKILEAAMQLGRERGLNMSEPLPKPMRVERLQARLAGFKRVSKPLLAADLAAALAANRCSSVWPSWIAARRITGAEALVRWATPQGLIQPNQLRRRETGLIHGVTDWVISSAVKGRPAGGPIISTRIAVRPISASDLVDLDLPGGSSNTPMHRPGVPDPGTH
jgi:CheY-like chemotaxis protein